MQELMVKPTVYRYAAVREFVEDFALGAGDLLITAEYIYKPVFEKLHLGCDVVFQEKYGEGEPSDKMTEAIYRDFPNDYKRIIAVGGGTILDIAKLFALERFVPVEELYDGKIVPKKNKKLVLVPTTCGTGSEMTNIAILALDARGTKKGLAAEGMYADSAVLIPELLESLPFSVFATSSVDALIHAVESSLSPKANATTKLFGYQAIRWILSGYQEILWSGRETAKSLSEQFLLASNYAGIAFGNAGCAAVHALSYPLGAKYHVAHGESNYAVFSGVMRNYVEMKPDGEIAPFQAFLASQLNCKWDEAYENLDCILRQLLPHKRLREYGMGENEITDFADSVLQNQQRLLVNNYVPFDRERIIKIYRELY